MDITINSKKFNVCATFYTRAEGDKKRYIFLEYPEHPGVLGYQLFDKNGSAYEVTEKTARAVAYRYCMKNPRFIRTMTKRGYKNV